MSYEEEINTFMVGFSYVKHDFHLKHKKAEGKICKSWIIPVFVHELGKKRALHITVTIK